MQWMADTQHMHTHHPFIHTDSERVMNRHNIHTQRVHSTHTMHSYTRTVKQTIHTHKQRHNTHTLRVHTCTLAIHVHTTHTHTIGMAHSTHSVQLCDLHRSVSIVSLQVNLLWEQRRRTCPRQRTLEGRGLPSVQETGPPHLQHPALTTTNRGRTD